MSINYYSILLVNSQFLDYNRTVMTIENAYENTAVQAFSDHYIAASILRKCII